MPYHRRVGFEHLAKETRGHCLLEIIRVQPSAGQNDVLHGCAFLSPAGGKNLAADIQQKQGVVHDLRRDIRQVLYLFPLNQGIQNDFFFSVNVNSIRSPSFSAERGPIILVCAGRARNPAGIISFRFPLNYVVPVYHRPYCFARYCPLFVPVFLIPRENLALSRISVFDIRRYYIVDALKNNALWCRMVSGV